MIYYQRFCKVYLPFNLERIRKVVDMDYTGPVLEDALSRNSVVHAIPDRGAYKGIPVVVTPLQDKDGKPIAAIGVVDVVCTIDLASVFGNYPQIVKQVEERKRVEVS